MSFAEDVLVERIRKGERNALVEFVESRKRQLLAYIQRSLSDKLRRKVEPQDILQEVTISALDSLERTDLSERNPFGWLCELPDRRIIDAHRKHVGAQKRSADREVGLGSPAGDAGRGGLINLLVASMTSPSGAFSRGQKEFHLLQALDTLPEESREAIRLRYVEGLPTKQVAERLGKTDGAVRVLLTRSLSRLQGLLAQNSAFQSFQTGRNDR